MPQLRVGTLLLLLLAGNVAAQEKWWFDVEVILFDRNQALTQLEEQFTYADSLAPYRAQLDLISDSLAPDIRRIRQSLPRCDAPPSPLWQPQPDLETILEDYRQYQASLPQSAQAAGTQPGSDTEYTTPHAARASEDVEALAQGEQRLAELTGTSQGTESDSAADTSPADTHTDIHEADQQTALTAADIAGLWLEFHGPDETNIEVPAVSFCHTPVQWFGYQNAAWTNAVDPYAVAMPDEVPITPNGVEWPMVLFPHLLPSNARSLTDLSQQIRQTRGLTRLLHTTWRQEVVFGRDNAKSVRLIAGKNYADTFDSKGNQLKQLPDAVSEDSDAALSEQEDLFDVLEQRLASPDAIDFQVMMAADPRQQQGAQSAQSAQTSAKSPIWQIDGGLKVFLRYINRVPYLHIDSELFYRQPVPLNQDNTTSDAPAYRLVSVPFDQLRRVISTQVHYFDHPLFGMIVEIRRYRPPEVPEEEQD
ncbi:CsiV family protein [Alteromonas halophila]|uniref:Peptidoglycan-binding protein CsiV n=1 Tax=Alteromonas halophila TaxID=516698 RepID=A0A918JHR5_9ALTE|nr:CsiV family protein [Alteromonas halophila]GGW76469.1 hypothetical protein GCM10007391_06390 [Alteromonas halophila]